MKEIVIDFRRYKDLGFSAREAAAFARMRLRARLTLQQHVRGRAAAPAAAPQSK